MTRSASARLALLALAASVVLLGTAGPAAAEEGDVPPIDVAVAVDESGSLSRSDVEQEKAAATTIALSELSAQSRITVFGFASRGANGRPAVESEQCVLERGASAADRDAMGQCIDQRINRRAGGDGDDTDFVAALDAGIAALGTGDRPKLLMLLTDGRLDVRGDTAYGPDEATQQRTAEDMLKQRVLPAARDRGIQIWPLGFGPGIDRGMLDAIAAGGAKARCGTGTVAPRATVVPDSGGGQLFKALQDAFASGRCGAVEFRAPRTIQSGGSVTLDVTIPPFATDGAITVYKADPRVRVTYVDPDGRTAPTGGTADGSTFEIAGSSGTVEALRITEPKPGTWRVVLTAPPGLTDQLVTVSALFQGVVRSVFLIDPPSPAPGQTFTVMMRPHTRSAEITDPQVLHGLTFTARLTGAGADTTRALLDDGKGPDARAGDGYYSAAFTLPPDANGQYTVHGSASGPGVAGTEDLQTFQAGRAAAVSAHISLDRSDVEAGTARKVVVTFANNDDGEHVVRLVIKDAGKGISASVTPPAATVPPGRSTVDYSLAFAADARGPSGGILQVVDAASGEVLASTPLSIKVVPSPRLAGLYGWLLTGLCACLAVALLRPVVRLRRDNRRSLWLILYYDAQPLVPELRIVRREARFEFDVRTSEDLSWAELRSAGRGTSRYVARRRGGDEVLLDYPGGSEPLVLGINGRPVALPHLPDYAIAVHRTDRVALRHLLGPRRPAMTASRRPTPGGDIEPVEQLETFQAGDWSAFLTPRDAGPAGSPAEEDEPAWRVRLEALLALPLTRRGARITAIDNFDRRAQTMLDDLGDPDGET